MMRYWINNHYEDFKKDPALLGLVHNFIQEVSENKKWKNYCASIRKLLNNQAEDVKKKPEIVRNENAPRVEWHLATPMDPSTFNLITVNSRLRRTQHLNKPKVFTSSDEKSNASESFILPYF